MVGSKVLQSRCEFIWKRCLLVIICCFILIIIIALFTLLVSSILSDVNDNEQTKILDGICPTNCVISTPTCFYFTSSGFKSEGPCVCQETNFDNTTVTFCKEFQTKTVGGKLKLFYDTVAVDMVWILLESVAGVVIFVMCGFLITSACLPVAKYFESDEELDSEMEDEADIALIAVVV
jgi:hypothetical protein